MKKRNTVSHLIVLTALGIFSLLILSCAKEAFTAKSRTIVSSAPSTQSYNSGQICSTSSVVRPNVDFLFLWDNSSSQTYVDPALKTALNSTINKISSQFDYHILMAPLIQSGANMDNAFFVSLTNDGLTQTVINNYKIDYNIAADKLQQIVNTTTGGSAENGIKRAYDLINANRTNGIFRKGGYTIVVVMSNGDYRIEQSGYMLQYPNPTVVAALNTYTNQLMALSTTMSMEQFRFMTLVSHNPDGVPEGYKKGSAYIAMSGLIYYNGAQKIAPTDQSGRTTPDSYNIAGADYTYIFDGINNAIQMVTVKHKYDWWPVTLPEPFDLSTLTVIKYNSSNNATVLTKDDQTNGYVYRGWQTNRNTRYEPTAGEPYTGNMIQLYGSGRITFPECIVMEATSPWEYWGYGVLEHTPLVSSIVYKKNNQSFSACGSTKSDCWEYLGYREDFNVKVVSPTDDTAATPAESATGYLIKLYGKAVYTNGDQIILDYQPSN